MDRSHSVPLAPQTRQESATTRRLLLTAAILMALIGFGAANAFGSADRSALWVTSHAPETNSATAGTAHTPSGVVTTSPAACVPSPCSAPDGIRNSATDSQVLFRTGLVASGSGAATFVLGPRHFGVVFVPEFVGASGGDLPAIESSPMVLGLRQLGGSAFVPEYVGASGGDLPAVESSPLVIGPRHTDRVAFVPVYVGHADGVFPETTR